ncbi:MAG: aspartate--tRNA ligase [Clostridia bacterium]
MYTYRTHKCDELSIENIGQTVRLSGFIKTKRNLGSVVFLDLRDHYGVTQILINSIELIELIEKVPEESTICVDGVVLKRLNVNKIMKTGEIEVEAKKIEILSKVENILPFQIEQSRNVKEDLRLEYRFLDLRNEEIHKKIVFRSKLLKTLRDKMDALDFVEVQTPILTSSSPEGARDFLVPSRIHEGEFYALPQAPQQFKQLLMISGFDKYYQIAPCFRDEDPRADRSPGEFYQLDFEMSFATQDDVLEVLEKVVGSTFRELTDKKVVEAPFKRITYNEAMSRFGTDKPDLRNPLEIIDVSEIFKDTEFKVFKNKTIKAIKINSENIGRKFFDKMSDLAVTKLGLNGLAWIKFDENMQLSGTITKYITENVNNALKDKLNVSENSAIFFIADIELKACKDAGCIRIELGEKLNLIKNDRYELCFIIDFPMYELDDDGNIAFNHNPFSMPVGGIDSLLTKDPLDIIAHQYDLVCNGYEIASGAVRNYEVDVMLKAFEIAGYSRKDVETKFKSLFNAFQYGAPPHAGAAPGIDRMVMLLCDEANIREVIAFPKNSKARDLLMHAPSSVTDKQLEDVHIKVIKKDKKS